MRPYLSSLIAGLTVGMLYSMLDMNSPAPPLVALIGLLGILAGEQIIPIIRHMLSGTSLTQAWRRQWQGVTQVFGTQRTCRTTTQKDRTSLD